MPSNYYVGISDLEIMNRCEFKRNRVHTQQIIYNSFSQAGLESDVTTLPGIAVARVYYLLSPITLGGLFKVNFVEHSENVFIRMQEEYRKLKETLGDFIDFNITLTFNNIGDVDAVPATKFEDIDTCARLSSIDTIITKRFSIQSETDGLKGFVFSVAENDPCYNQKTRLEFFQENIIRPLGAEIAMKAGSHSKDMLENDYPCNRSFEPGSWSYNYEFAFRTLGKRLKGILLFRFSEGRPSEKGKPGPNAYVISTFAVLYK